MNDQAKPGEIMSVKPPTEPQNDRRFSQTTAVVTGASSGIGRATAVALAYAGAAELVIHYRSNRQGAEETAEAVRGAGAEATIVSGDLADAADVDRICEESFRRLGVIHTWVNNAGADVLTGDSASMTFDEKVRLLFDVDVLGTIRLSRAAASRMRLQATELPSSMTLIGWDQAPAGMEGDAGQMFGPVKAAVMAFSASLAQTVAPKIRVNTVSPGWIRTSWGESTDAYWDRRAQRQSLMGRWGTPDDVARAIAYVATPANTFMSGAVLEVNGGWNRAFPAE